ncbi:MAG: pyridoxal-dependent decarboxylase, partial [Pseudomonadota bacterium]
MTNNPMDWGHKALDWGRAYRAGMRDRPVRAQVAPGDILALLPENPPETPEPMEAIWADFERIVPHGLTHWQHPRFFAYFSSNAAPASVLAEHLVAEIAAQGMLWQTAPVVTELEMRMIRWLAEALGLPEHFTGVTHDTASTATFTAVLTMRERALNWAGNARGLASGPRLRIYASA